MLTYADVERLIHLEGALLEVSQAASSRAPHQQHALGEQKPHELTQKPQTSRELTQKPHELTQRAAESLAAASELVGFRHKVHLNRALIAS